MKKPCLSAAVVVEKLRSTMGEVSDFATIPEGEESQAFRFRSGADPYIVRLNGTVEGFEKDAFAHRRFAGPNLPIPAVIHVGEIDQCFLCISEAVPGVTLQDLRLQDMPALLNPTASVLDAISTADIAGIQGFGPFDSHGVSAFTSWREFLTEVADARHYDWIAMTSQLPIKAIDVCLARLMQLVEQCPEKRALVHGDFGSNNVLTDGDRITGVIDWSEALLGDPLYDVANILFWSTWLECMRQQALYFEASLPLAQMKRRLLCYQLRIGLAETYQQAMRGNASVASWALARCLDLIDAQVS